MGPLVALDAMRDPTQCRRAGRMRGPPQNLLARIKMPWRFAYRSCEAKVAGEVVADLSVVLTVARLLLAK